MPSSFPTPPPDTLVREEAPGYRPVSMLAVLGLIAGILSALALVEPLLWVLPPLGLALSAAGLSQTARGEARMSGHKAAVLGLVLSVMFGVAAPTRFLVRNWILTKRAQQFTDAWVEHVRNGRFYQAHQFTVHPRVRMPLDSSLDQLYANDVDTKQSYGRFMVKPPMDVLAAQWKGTTVRHVRHLGSGETPEADSFAELYEFEFPPGAQPGKVRVQLIVVRTEDPVSGNEGWQLRYVEPGDSIPD
jgi:hypothetical protein